MKAWRAQQARRIIAESAAIIAPELQIADRLLPDHHVDAGDHRAGAAMGF